MSHPSTHSDVKTLTFRRAGMPDAEPLCSFASAVFLETFSAHNTPENMAQYMQSAFTPEKIREEICDQDNVFVLAEQEQTILGYYKLKEFDRTDPSLPDFKREKPSIQLERFYVDFNWHGTSVAGQMMQHCLDLCQSMQREILWLGVWEKNIRAQKFYQKWNFEIAGSRSFMLGTESQSDYWMVRSL